MNNLNGSFAAAAGDVPDEWMARVNPILSPLQPQGLPAGVNGQAPRVNNPGLPLGNGGSVDNGGGMPPGVGGPGAGIGRAPTMPSVPPMGILPNPLPVRTFTQFYSLEANDPCHRNYARIMECFCANRPGALDSQA